MYMALIFCMRINQQAMRITEHGTFVLQDGGLLHLTPSLSSSPGHTIQQTQRSGLRSLRAFLM
jgi:hypothetical protein